MEKSRGSSFLRRSRLSDSCPSCTSPSFPGSLAGGRQHTFPAALTPPFTACHQLKHHSQNIWVAGGEREGQEVSAFTIWLFSLDKCLPLVFSRLAPSSSNSSAYRPTDSPRCSARHKLLLLAHPSGSRKTAKEGAHPHSTQGKGDQPVLEQTEGLPSLPFPTNILFFQTNSGNDWPCQHEIPYPAQGFMPLLSLQSPRTRQWKRTLCDNNPQFGTTLGLARLRALK